MSTAAEPAIKSYFFGKGYRDLWATIRDSWRLNLETAGGHFNAAASLIPGDYWDKAKGIFLGTASVAVILFGTAFFILASAVHVVVLVALLVTIYLAFSLVYLLERAVLLIKKYFTVCPICHEKFDLPEYFCPGCGAVHRRLIPSSYGILWRTCRCGTRLPATFFLKRGELRSRCSKCEELLEQDHLESRKIFVPIVGGPAVGKSAFLYSAAQRLLDEEAGRLGLVASFAEAASEGDLARAKAALQTGRAPDKTVDTLPRAFNIRLEGRGGRRLLYLYDPAGEAFNDTTDLILHRFQGFLSGMIFLIDPFSIRAVRAEYADQLSGLETALNPSRLPVTDALSRVLVTMEEHFGLAKTGRLKSPVAVVLSKLDAFDLDDRLGEPAISRHITAASEPLDRARARDSVIRDQLVRWDQADLVQQLETRFTRVAYFSCTALGRMPDATGRPFEPQGIMEPLLWILGDADRVFRQREVA